MTIILIALICFPALLAAYLLWAPAAPRSGWLKPVIFAASCAASLGAAVLSTGHARPIWALLPAERAGSVIGLVLDPDAGLAYIWIVPKGSMEPLALVKPFDPTKIEAEQQAWKDRDKYGNPEFDPAAGIHPEPFTAPPVKLSD